MTAWFIRSAAFCSPESLSMILPSVSFQMGSVHALVVVRANCQPGSRITMQNSGHVCGGYLGWASLGGTDYLD